MGRLRTPWIGLLALAVPPLGLIQAGAGWPICALFAGFLVAESAWLTFQPPDGLAVLLVLFAWSLASRVAALVLAVRAARRNPPPLPWPRRWYALPIWAALLFGAMPDTWIGTGFEAFYVPSASMEPTLLVNERFFAHAPADPPDWRRGDVLVFRTGPEEVVYVKRLIGLPGDRIQVRQGILHINDAPAQRETLGPWPGGGTRYRETLPGGAAHEILETSDQGWLDNTAVFQVPAGQLFFMGDNRDNSADSRQPGGIGFIPEDRVVGRARFIFWGPESTRIGARLD